MNKPIAVLISDIHFSEKTLELASKALVAAIDKAASLCVPLFICGDLHDTKAIIRGEVANTLIEILENAVTRPYIIVGNHDRLNEKHTAHGLNYLRPYAWVIDESIEVDGFWTIPYHGSNEIDSLENTLNSIKPGSILLMHQGFLGAEMGDYIKDDSSISTDLVKDFVVFTGHYHKHQTLKSVTYIGNPYTVSFNEANDPPKGFLILNDDGSFTRQILNLRKHLIIETRVDGIDALTICNTLPQDLLWLKISGPESQLRKLNKEEIGMRLIGHTNYRFDPITDDIKKLDVKTDTMTDEQILDLIIENTGENVEELKKLWRKLA